MWSGQSEPLITFADQGVWRLFKKGARQYTLTLADIAFDAFGNTCTRTASLMPEFASHRRGRIVVIALPLIARLLPGMTLKPASESAKLAMPHQWQVSG